jgi:hypothetical protein
MREVTCNEAVVEAVAEEVGRDPKILYISTDPCSALEAYFQARTAPAARRRCRRVPRMCRRSG